MTTFNLSEFKRLAGERTAGGRWKYECERYSAKDIVGIDNDDRWIAHFQPEFNGQANAKFAAYCGTHADAIIERIEKLEKVAEAAKAFSKTPLEDFRGGVNRELLDDLNSALEKLEEL